MLESEPQWTKGRFFFFLLEDREDNVNTTSEGILSQSDFGYREGFLMLTNSSLATWMLP